MVEVLVDAVEDGKIVRVSETYARREGLLIVKKPKPELPKFDPNEGSAHMRERRGLKPFDIYRRPLKASKNNVLNELVENFHWTIVQKRKARGWTRKQFADVLGEKEDNVKLIENGILPADDFILINKIERVFGISFRKDGKNYNESARVKVEAPKEEFEPQKEAVSAEDLVELKGESKVDLDMEDYEKKAEEYEKSDPEIDLESENKA